MELTCKPKYKKEILYPIFIQISQCNTDEDDKFWSNLFLEMSYGIFPLGVFMENNIIYCNFKDKKFNYDLSNKTHNQIYQDLSTVLKNIGICSKLELSKQKIKFQTLLEVSNKDWNSIKKKKIRDMLIEKYIIRIKRERQYNINKTIRLYKKIILGLFFKTITNQDIEYDKDIGIVNIKINPILDNEIIKLVKTKKIKKTMSNNWIKFIKT